MIVKVFFVDGTWSPNGGTPQAEQFRHEILNPHGANLYEFEYVSYPATYGGADEDFNSSVSAGVLELLSLAQAHSGPQVWAGYSQGAEVVARLAARVARGEFAEIDLRGVALISDPGRPKGKGFGASANGYGVTGERPIEDGPGVVRNIFALWVSVLHDTITDLPAGNPIRSIADFSEYYSVRSFQDFNNWMIKILEKAVIERDAQPWWAWQNILSWGGAIDYALNYLVRGKHTDEYVNQHLCARLALMVKQELS